MKSLIDELEKRVIHAKNEIKSIETKRAQVMSNCDLEIRCQQAIIDNTEPALKILKAHSQ